MNKTRVMHHYFEPRFIVLSMVRDVLPGVRYVVELHGEFDEESKAEQKALELARTGKGQFLVVSKRTTWEPRQ